MIRSFMLALLFALSAPTLAAPTADAARPVINVEQHENIRVAYDVKDDVWDAGIGKALYYVRGLLEAYKDQGVAPRNLHISVVLHGPAAYWVLNDAAYQRHKKDEFAYNPNDKVINELLAHGVSVELCGVTMKSMGWTEKDVLPGVKIVHDAYTRLIDLQQRGYAYIRF
ncbi:DsrE family protein [Thermithiobacillus plumbiphilus]|uniref:DsrE family protein n=1 Tax=Thermithiobacillus plumbiphilus TaxID=1729899 RepID=A0ABU9DA79_9PROT